MLKKFFLIISFVTLLGACAERHQGPAERAGERLDEIGDNISKGKAPLHKAGPMEKAGDAIDDAMDSDRDRY